MRHGSWVVIADGEKALFCRNKGDDEMILLETISAEAQHNPPTREQGTDKPGRKQDTGVQQTSAVEPTDWHWLEKQHFARGISQVLYKEAHRGRFDDLVLVAPPRILGELRDNLHKEVQDRLSKTIAKDLTNHPIDQIESLLAREV